jgi:hypothetical protein
MADLLRRAARDIRRLRNIDAYAVALLIFAFAVASVTGDALSGNLRWAVLLAGVGVLVFRVTLPEGGAGHPEDTLKDRRAFDEVPCEVRIRSARELWVYAPTGINLLSPQTCETIRTSVLGHPDGLARVAVLDPGADAAVGYATGQLDNAQDYPPQLFLSSLQETVHRLRRLAGTKTSGRFSYRFLGFNPGFSLVAIDPRTRHGLVIVEFHGFHNDMTASRMHIELSPGTSEQWYRYWLDQFEHIWQAAREPAGEEAGGPAAPVTGLH